MTTKPTMAEVLELHRIGHTIGYAVHCVCDSKIGIGMSPDVFYRHQADMLAAAGYGDVTDAKAEAPAGLLQNEGGTVTCCEDCRVGEVCARRNHCPCHDTRNT